MYSSLQQGVMKYLVPGLFPGTVTIRGDEGNLRWYRVTDGQSCIFNVYVEQFPGCCGAVIVHDLAYINNLELAPIFEALEKASSAAGYTVVMYTTTPGQVSIIKALEQRKFKRSYAFMSKRTNNDITFWIKNLKEAEAEVTVAA